ncbi:hypothetical protein [Flaviflexus salsibiostraticola]|uniref:hypothetical protein n=1 Tax=Flaviflexus salsibiostraticola TaxID=1282737 RepID=UPI001FEC4DC4|nr:hypothetical protein [Flaviflexus salsibiostraticola]
MTTSLPSGAAWAGIAHTGETISAPAPIIANLLFRDDFICPSSLTRPTETLLVNLSQPAIDAQVV